MGSVVKSEDSPSPGLGAGMALGGLPNLGERYCLEKEVGRGGMGRVFLARDLKLGREVAIKILSPGEHSEDELRRFEQEARATGSLNHPNIVDVHDIGTYEGAPYIVSELLHGATLRERLAGKSLPLRKALDYAVQLAQGLATAHDKGVIHRDLKPENLFITNEGVLKILDFGIAKLLSSVGTTPREGAPLLDTGAGAVMGTAPYMSPEQVRGQPVDHRSDIFAAGAILYEMLAGKRAFEREAPVETGYAILSEEPPDFPGSVSPEMERVVRRCLEKKPEDRFQSARELAFSLAKLPLLAPARSWRWPAAFAAIAATIVAAVLIERTRARSPGSGEASIAVVPFVNMSSDKENEYFSDGITEELINVMANIPRLRVASRTSVFALRNKGLDARQIGERLNVKTLLEGSVRREGNALRVTAQLINVADDVHLWSQSYDRELKSIFELEDEIARSIAQTLRHKLIGGESAALVKPSTASLEAHDLYLRGQYFKERRSLESLRKAAAYFEQAIEKDPAYALAYLGLANATVLQASFDEGQVMSLLPKAKQAVSRALELDPGIAEAHASLGLIAEYDYDWLAAERSLRRAIQLKPDYPEAHHWYASVLGYTGRLREAHAEAEEALRLDPTSLIRNFALATLAMWERDYRAAEDGFRRTLELDPGFAPAHSNLAVLYTLEKRHAEAEAELDKGDPSFAQKFRGFLYAMEGQGAKALAVLEELEERAKREYESPASRGWIWVALGEKERGYALLHRACVERGQGLLITKVNPLFDSMRSDPGFKSLLKCIHLE